MKRITMAATVVAFLISLAGLGFAAQGNTAAMNMQQHQALCGNVDCCASYHTQMHTQMQMNTTPAQQGERSMFQQIQPSNQG